VGLLYFLAACRVVTGAECATDNPQPFMGGPGGPAVSAITITDNFLITDITVTLHVTHPDVSLVNVNLIAPDQTLVQLWGNETAAIGEANLGSTCIPTADFAINDSGSTNVVPPFIGTYVSRGFRSGTSPGLAQFNGTDANGTWTLVAGSSPSATGVLECWCLEFNGRCGMEKVVILAGGPETSPNWFDIDRLGKLAYSTFSSRLFGPEDIFYLSPSQPVIVHGQDVFDATSTLSNLQFAISNWADGAFELSVYLVGESTNGMLQVNDTETLFPTDLRQWLNDFQTGGQHVNVVMEFSGSGDYLPVLTPLAGEPRIVVGTSPFLRESVLALGISFSDFLYSDIAAGQTWGQSIRDARIKARQASGNVRQKVVLDDNGNGIPNEKDIDGLLADTIPVGRPSGQDHPVFGNVNNSVTVTNENITNLVLFADSITDEDGVGESWVEVTSPTNFLGEPSERVDLLLQTPLARWEGDYDNFVEPGFYTLSFYARDNVGNVTAGPQSRILKTDMGKYDVTDPLLPDMFEPDDSPTNANYSDLPIIQYHTLPPNDCDWVRFYATTQDFFDVETVHPPGIANVDTSFSLYRVESDGDLTLIRQVDEFGVEQGELAGLDFPSNGFYLIQTCVVDGAGGPPFAGIGGLPVFATLAGMTMASGGGSGGGVMSGGYFLGTYVPSGIAGINVVVLDTVTEAALQGTYVELRTLGGAFLASDTVGPSGLVSFGYPKGSYEVEATPTNVFHLPIFDQTDSTKTAANPLSDFGNPRELSAGDFATVSYGATVLLETTFMGFYFHPAAIVTGMVVDASTCDPVESSIMQAVRNSDLAVFNRWPWSTYGDFWYTSSSGNFSNNLYLLADGSTYTIFVQKSGYIANNEGNYSPSLADIIDLGTVYVTSIDTNANDIPDSWEQKHFSGLISGTDDTDSDYHTDFEEYVAGTDPNDSGSVFKIPDVHETNANIAVTWTVEKNREYRVHSYDLLSSNLTAHTSWTASPMSATHMGWTNTTPVTTNEMHVIEVRVP
jgi:subtilisin-like proprotein convertase family protein